MAFKSESDAQKAIRVVLEKAYKDPAFRSLCLKDPAAAVKQATGDEIPANFKVQFVDNKHANLTLVLPDLVDPSGELKDSELESVAGGGRCAASCAASCLISTCLCVPLPSVTGSGL